MSATSFPVGVNMLNAAPALSLRFDTAMRTASLHTATAGSRLSCSGVNAAAIHAGALSIHLTSAARRSWRSTAARSSPAIRGHTPTGRTSATLQRLLGFGDLGLLGDPRLHVLAAEPQPVADCPTRGRSGRRVRNRDDRSVPRPTPAPGPSWSTSSTDRQGPAGQLRHARPVPTAHRPARCRPRRPGHPDPAPAPPADQTARHPSHACSCLFPSRAPERHSKRHSYQDYALTQTIRVL